MKTYKLKVEKTETSFVEIKLPTYLRDKKFKSAYYKIFSANEYRGAVKVSEHEISSCSPDLPYHVYGKDELEEISEKDFKKQLEKTFSELKKL